MFGFLLFSAVVLSAVDVGSSITISYALQEYVWSYESMRDRCQVTPGLGHGFCGPEIYSHVTFTDNNRVVSSYPQHQSKDYPVFHNDTFPFWDVVDDKIQIPIFLRLVATVDLKCEQEDEFDKNDPPWCVGPDTSASASVLQLIKIPKFSDSFQHFEVQLPLDKTFDISIFLIVNISGMTEGSDCVDIGSDKDFCPQNQPFFCPIFRNEMTNPCCPVDIESSCMLRNESNIKTTTTTTTTTTTPTTTTTVPTTTTTTTVPTTTTTIPSTTTTILSTTTTTPITTSTTQTTSISPTTTTFLTTTTTSPTTPITTPTAGTTVTTTVATYQDSTEVSPIATATDTTATTTSRENTESTSITTAKKLCTPATTSTTSETAETDSYSPAPCRENVYFWVMIEFILLTAVLLISLIFIAICNPRQKNNFVEEDESDEEDPQ